MKILMVFALTACKSVTAAQVVHPPPGSAFTAYYDALPCIDATGVSVPCEQLRPSSDEEVLKAIEEALGSDN